MTPPERFQRSHSQVEAGTWSDDGAQALCLIDSLLSQGTFSLEHFSNLLLSWYEEGVWAVGISYLMWVFRPAMHSGLTGKVCLPGSVAC